MLAAAMTARSTLPTRAGSQPVDHTGVAVTERPVAFAVHLDVFDGPFDLLLGLISKHKLDITEVALAQVTDEFIAYMRAAPDRDLDQLSGFLVVAATLVDLKAARLLPSATVEDEEDLAVLEARDLLFARLLEYKAYKEVARWLTDQLEGESCWVGRSGGVPAQLVADLPPATIDLSLEAFVQLANVALAPRAPAVVALDHIHVARISVPEHMAILTERLAARGSATFRALCADCVEPIEVIARFLALLELFREGHLGVEQAEPLADLHVRWISGPSAAEPVRVPASTASGSGDIDVRN